jgi:dolichol kinase
MGERRVTMAEAHDPHLEALVHKTSGLQPLRRVLHFGAGVVVVAAVATGVVSRQTLVGILAILFGLSLLADLMRLRWTHANRMFFRAFVSLASPREAGKVASSTWYVLGVLLVFGLFPQRIAMAATLILAVADPVGNLVGRSLGRRRFGTGTVESTTALILASFLAALVFVPVGVAAVAAVAVGLVETRDWRFDDNLTVPLAAATVLSLIYALMP